MQCSSKVLWKQENGTWRCENPDGSDHWDLCSQERWKKISKRGKRFIKEDRSGYKFNGKEKLDWMKSREIVGEDYKESGCNCDIPPWEACPHSFDMQFGRAYNEFKR
jgi:hypothetical protein